MNWKFGETEFKEIFLGAVEVIQMNHQNIGVRGWGHGSSGRASTRP
jgi:hypothetical protein